jgi:hypothetical protein
MRNCTGIDRQEDSCHVCNPQSPTGSIPFAD